MADSTPTPNTDATNTANSANSDAGPADEARLQASAQDGVIRGHAAQDQTAGQGGPVTERPLTDTTQVITDVTPGDNFLLPGGVTLADLEAAGALEQQGGSLVITLPSGSVITLQDYFLFIDSGLPPALTLADGTVIDANEVVALLGNAFDPNAIAAAAGGAGGGGAGNASFTPYASGDIGPGAHDIGLLGDLPGFPFQLPEGQEPLIDTAEAESLTGMADTAVPPLLDEAGDPVEGAVSGAFSGAFENSEPNKHIGSFEQALAHVTFDFIPVDNEFIDQITLSGFPAGATLFVGGVATAINGPGDQVVVLNADLDNVFLLMPQDPPDGKSDADIQLNYLADIHDPENGSAALSGSFEVIVDAVADIPSVDVPDGNLMAQPGQVLDLSGLIDVAPTDTDGSEQTFAIITVTGVDFADMTLSGAPSLKLIDAGDSSTWSYQVGDATVDLSAKVAELGSSFWAVLDSDLGNLSLTFDPNVLDDQDVVNANVVVIGGSVEQETDLGTDELTLLNNVAYADGVGFLITIEGNPIPVVEAVTGTTVDEDGFEFANLDAARPGEFDSNELLSNGGSIVVVYGDDVPGTLDGSLVLLDTGALDGQLKTLDGQDVTFDLVGGKLVGSAGGPPVITIEILSGATLTDAGTGTVTYDYLVTLDQPVMHSDPDVEDFEVLSGVTFAATDSSGDTVQGNFSVTVYDDIPIALDGENAHVSDGVEEDDLNNSQSLGYNEDASSNAYTTSGGAGSLSALFSAGADAPLSFGLLDSTGGLPLLLSKGDPVAYDVVFDDNGTPDDPSDDIYTLTASADGSVSGDGPRDVFTLVVNGDGSWTFTLIDQLDHVGGGGENFALQLSGGGSVNFIDFSSILTATDADGDTVTGAATEGFIITVQDDVPVADGEAVGGTVYENELDTSWSTGTDQAGISGDDDNGDSNNDDTVATGSLAGLVTSGADEPVLFSLSADTSGLEGQGLTAKGDTLIYDVSLDDKGNSDPSDDTYTLTASVDGSVSGDAPHDVFTLVVDADGTWTFTLLDQLDHDLDDGPNTLTIDFTSILAATDFDQDPVSFDANDFTVTVVDDVPSALFPEAVYLENVATPTQTFDLNFIAGADEIGTVVFNIVGDGSEPALDVEGNQLFLNGEELFLFFGDGPDETTLIAKTAGGETGFMIDIDTTTMTGTFTFLSTGIISNGTEVTPASLAGVGGGFQEFKGLIDIGGTDQDVLMSTASGSSLNTNQNEIGIDSGNSFEGGEGIRFDLVNGLALDAGEPSGFAYDDHNLTNAFRQSVRLTGNASQRADFTVYAIVADDDQALFGTPPPTETGETRIDLDPSNIRIFDDNGVLVWDGSTSTVVDLSVSDNGDGVTIEGVRDGWTYQIVTQGETEQFSAVQLDAEVGTDTFKLGSFTYGEGTPGEPIDLAYSITGTDGDGDSLDGVINATLYPEAITITGDDGNNTLIAADFSGELDPNAGVVLLGYGGDDTLTGGLGHDVLVGGAGDDTLDGGGGGADGADTFVYDGSALADGVTDHDVIHNFGADDTIDLDALFDALGIPAGETERNPHVQFTPDGADTIITVTDGSDNPVADFSIVVEDFTATISNVDTDDGAP